ncbi:MAG TPA: hypothetical protein VFP41_06285 [Actinomycetota bacterium]|nr:hypothetical protein [Actinomycetota bacterium]
MSGADPGAHQASEDGHEGVGPAAVSTSSANGSGGSPSLEVRWIHQGPIPPAMLGWMGPFDAWIERREDRYLVDPALPDLGVKIKGGSELDLKAFRGDAGLLDLPGGRGRLERWAKWRFPLNSVTLPSTGGSSWLALRKTRHRRSFRRAGDGVVERPVAEAEMPGCSVELTTFEVGRETWWTLALEAAGEPGELEPVLRATAELLSRGERPSDIDLRLEDSMSYPRWLASRRA